MSDYLISRMAALRDGDVRHVGVGVPSSDKHRHRDEQRGVILVAMVDGREWIFPTGTFHEALTMFGALLSSTRPHKTFHAIFGKRGKPDDEGTWECW